mgnify:FL=1
MSIDDADPSCPECGEPVGTNASYCMHCGAEFDFADGVEEDGGGLLDSIIDAIDGTTDESPEVESTAATVENERGGTVGGDTDAGATASVTANTGSTASGGSDDGSTASGGAGGGSTASRGAEAGTADDSGGLLDPDGLLDNSLTVVVGIGAGIVIGLISLFVFGIAFGGTGVLLAFVAWLGSTAYLARRRTVFDAVRDGAFGLAAVLVIAGIGASVGTAMDGNSIVAALVVLVPFVFFAGLVAGTGYAIGTFGVE